jgi:two-component system LytT family sensor kinase
LHGAATTNPYLAGDLIGFTAGLAITLLLLVLVLRAGKLPGTPVANVLLALCALLWNVGGLAHAVLLAVGEPREGRAALVSAAVQFSAAGAWPIPVLAIWRHFAILPWQQTASRILTYLAILSAAGIAICLWSAAALDVRLFPSLTVKEFASYNASLLLALGAGLVVRSPLTSAAIRFSSLTIVLAIFGTAVSIIILNTFSLNAVLGSALQVASEQLVLLAVVGAFFLFTRFRFADLFIRYSVRILLAGACALILALLVQAPFVVGPASRTAFPLAVRVFASCLFASALLLAFAFADRRIGMLVNKWIFRAPDYRAAMQHLRENLGHLHFEPEIAAAVEKAAGDTLELSGVRLVPFDKLAAPPCASPWPATIVDGEVVELERELLVPVSSGGRVTHVLAVSPGLARTGLVTHEVNYLRTVAAQCGNRLDAIHLEREMVERRSREALLLQQVTEAELRALRAQINPHFLFNALNTLANLIVTDPARAETMTLRLAKVFRHVLAHSSRPLTSIGEEIEFLRTYLSIEEARFGSRLHIAIDMAAEVALDHIPSLILQPIVENALKHGLGPKTGAGHLWISAFAQGSQVCLQVEDDGVGPAYASRVRPRGVGLTNVSERLSTLYHDRAGLSFEPRENGGSRVRVLIPRGNGDGQS